MNFSTFIKRSTLIGAMSLVGLCASAEDALVFVYDGIIYKTSQVKKVNTDKLTVQKPGTKTSTGQESPASYSGDVTIPLHIDYNGVTYTVESVAAAFKAQPITSIHIADGVVTLSRGAFDGCTSLTSVRLPSDLVKSQADIFSGCTSLKEVSIPGGSNPWNSNSFKGCTSLEKLVFEDGDEALKLSINGFTDNGNIALKYLELNRNIDATYKDLSAQPFRGAKALETVVLGGHCTSVFSGFLENCTSLKNFTAAETFTSMETRMFAGSGLEEITIPAGVTTIPSEAFSGCANLKKVNLHNGVTTISDMAFNNSPVAEINFNEGLTSIGQVAFANAKLSGDIVLPSTLTRLGIQAFANNSGITSVSIPAATTTIGDGAFYGCAGIKNYVVAEGNENYKVTADGASLYSADGKTLIVFAPASATTTIKGDYEKIAPYAAYCATGVSKVELPACTNWGDYSFYGTGLTEITLGGTIGRYVAANCPALKTLTVKGAVVPFGVATNDAALETVNLDSKVTTVKQDAFKGCTSLKSLNLGSILAILEADAFTGAGLQEITVGAANPAAMTEGVFTAADAALTVKVPVDLVDVYKNATGWSYLNIVGDANIAKGPEDMGMPAGLYYAGEDGNIHCVYDLDSEETTYDVGGVPHTFQLAEFKNRIYGASAGKKFVYSNTGSIDGDGKLFYISKVGGETFQAVVLDNTGNNAYKDPFGIYIYGDTLYVNDRNVCIRKIPADAIALPQDYPSWMENNWMGWYGMGWTYGCIKSGWAITNSENEKGEPEPEYWLGLKYNGNGIYRFKEEHVGTSSKPGVKPDNSSYLTALSPIFTTFYLDEKNDHFYIYLECFAALSEDKWVKAGLYRVKLSDLMENPEPQSWADLNPVLVDGSPVKYEGSSTNEHVGISQLTADADGKYLYWCYRAPTAEEAEAQQNASFADSKEKGKYYWAEDYDENNPLHKSGIKRIKLGEENPVVEMVKEGPKGYGVVPVNYEGSAAGVQDITVVTPAADLKVVGDQLVAGSAATVYVYNMAGLVVAYAELEAGESLDISALKGAYIATANGAAVKFVK